MIDQGSTNHKRFDKRYKIEETEHRLCFILLCFIGLSFIIYRSILFPLSKLYNYCIVIRWRSIALFLTLIPTRWKIKVFAPVPNNVFSLFFSKEWKNVIWCRSFNFHFVFWRAWTYKTLKGAQFLRKKKIVISRSRTSKNCHYNVTKIKNKISFKQELEINKSCVSRFKTLKKAE
jgi:hypothetical protein